VPAPAPAPEPEPQSQPSTECRDLLPDCGLIRDRTLCDWAGPDLDGATIGQMCPITCREGCGAPVPCDDDPDWRFATVLSCEHFVQLPGLGALSLRCEQQFGTDGRDAYSACQASCPTVPGRPRPCTPFPGG
jgi:hypothetical protein